MNNTNEKLKQWLINEVRLYSEEVITEEEAEELAASLNKLIQRLKLEKLAFLH